MTDDDEFDPPEMFDEALGKALRDDGMEKVIRGNPAFADEFFQYVVRLPRGWIGKTEDIRDVWTGTHAKPQAWGACWSGFVKCGLLVRLPDEVHMENPKSHGRRTHLYIRT
jgi:hypothetical protein